MSKIKNLKRSDFGQSIFFRAQNALCGKTGGAIIGQPTYPHSILMQESKDMREKNTEPEIYMDVKVTNNGWCVLDYDL